MSRRGPQPGSCPSRLSRTTARMVALAVLVTALCGAAAFPALASDAALGGGVSGGAASGATVVLALADSVNQVLDNVRNWIVGILAALATVFLTIGGARYLIAGGDPSEVEKGRSALRSAAFGYALAALAPLVVEILKGIVGA